MGGRERKSGTGMPGGGVVGRDMGCPGGPLKGGAEGSADNGAGGKRRDATRTGIWSRPVIVSLGSATRRRRAGLGTDTVSSLLSAYLCAQRR